MRRRDQTPGEDAERCYKEQTSDLNGEMVAGTSVYELIEKVG